MKIALVHDYVKEMGGAERVLVTLAKMYPDAPIYTAFVDRNSTAARTFRGRVVVESSWGWLLKIGKLYSYLRFCLPWVFGGLDLREYDLVITSCSGYIARGFRVSPRAKVVAYCHTPPRWLYGYETPTGAQQSWYGKAYLWIFGPFVRHFDYIGAQRVNLWIANSQEVASRIAKFYRKEAVVIYPPCEVAVNPTVSKTQEYWLIVSRIVGGKGLLIAAEAAHLAKQKLVIVGTGDKQLTSQIASAGGSYVEMRGYVPDQAMGEIYSMAKGFVALATDEDFGMSVVEAMAHGVPVLAYHGGGYLETVTQGMNGEFVPKLDTTTIAKKMKDWEGKVWDHNLIQKSVQKFGRERFVKEFYARVARG
jgi:glycosyltransferase involved in cell wall biosynthesis